MGWHTPSWAKDEPREPMEGCEYLADVPTMPNELARMIAQKDHRETLTAEDEARCDASIARSTAAINAHYLRNNQVPHAEPCQIPPIDDGEPMAVVYRIGPVD